MTANRYRNGARADVIRTPGGGGRHAIGAALTMASANTEAMNEHLKEIGA